jgi:peptidoglycan hydrolase-like protein with peptidoglycan-binding domain
MIRNVFVCLALVFPSLLLSCTAPPAVKQLSLAQIDYFDTAIQAVTLQSDALLIAAENIHQRAEKQINESVENIRSRQRTFLTETLPTLDETQRRSEAEKRLNQLDEANRAAAESREKLSNDLEKIKAKTEELRTYIAKMKDVQVALNAYLESEEVGIQVTRGTLGYPTIENLLSSVNNLIPKMTGAMNEVKALIVSSEVTVVKPPPSPQPVAVAPGDKAKPGSKSVPSNSAKKQPESKDIDKKTIRRVQRALGLRGYKVDGIMQAETRTLIRQCQAKQGLPETGALTPKLVKELLDFGACLTKDNIVSVQRALGLKDNDVDAIFGETTRQAIKNYQEKRGYEVTGELTRALFDELTSNQRPEGVTGRGNAFEATLGPTEVVALQKALGLKGAAITGKFDPKTREAIRQAQRKYGFKQTGLLSMDLEGELFPTEAHRLTSDQIIDVQRALGLRDNDVDGRIGPTTRAKIRAWERAQGLPVTGRLTAGLRLEILEWARAQERKTQEGNIPGARTETEKREIIMPRFKCLQKALGIDPPTEEFDAQTRAAIKKTKEAKRAKFPNPNDQIDQREDIVELTDGKCN